MGGKTEGRKLRGRKKGDRKEGMKWGERNVKREGPMGMIKEEERGGKTREKWGW